MHVPIRPLKGRWPLWFERRSGRFLRGDPSALLAGDVTPDDFRAAMAQIHVGDTIKITGADRHRKADALVLGHIDAASLRFVDMGASDGSTSVDLIRKLPAFNSYVIADLYLSISAVRLPRHTLFFDMNGECILVIGRRIIGWPSESRLVRWLYSPVTRRTASLKREEVLLLNPETRNVLAQDDRVTARVHDVFTKWPEPSPDVIKVANLLRRLYFSDEDIDRGLRALHASLSKGGHLLIVDNPRIAGIDERAGLYHRTEHAFELVAHTDNVPEIEDLILNLRV